MITTASHRSEQRAREAEGPEHVDRERPLQRLAVGVRERPQRDVTQRARPVHQDVNPAEGGHRLPRDTMDRLLLPDVPGDRVGLAPRRGDLRRHPIERRRRARHERHPRAPPTERQRQRAAQALSCPGDHDAKSLDVHVAYLLR